MKRKPRMKKNREILAEIDRHEKRENKTYKKLEKENKKFERKLK